MASLRRLARMCRNLAKQHVDDPDVPAAPDGADGYAEWVQIALILFRVELEKSLRETEDYLNEMPHVLAVFELDEAPHYSSFCRWEQQYRMRELRRLLRNAEDLRVLSADANYSWGELREECRSESTRPLIKHREQTPLQKAHNARMNDDYNQRWMSETGFSQLKEDDGEKLRSRSWHGQFRELTRKCIVHNLTQAAS